MKRRREPNRTATCRLCGKEWQISALAVIPPEGYICPVCETSQRKERSHDRLQKSRDQNPGKNKYRPRRYTKQSKAEVLREASRAGATFGPLQTKCWQFWKTPSTLRA